MEPFIQDMAAAGDEIGPEDEDRWYLRKVDGGLFTLQTADYILAWICMDDDGVSRILGPTSQLHVLTSACRSELMLKPC